MILLSAPTHIASAPFLVLTGTVWLLTFYGIADAPDKRTVRGHVGA